MNQSFIFYFCIQKKCDEVNIEFQQKKISQAYLVIATACERGEGKIRDEQGGSREGGETGTPAQMSLECSPSRLTVLLS